MKTVRGKRKENNIIGSAQTQEQEQGERILQRLEGEVFMEG